MRLFYICASVCKYIQWMMMTYRKKNNLSCFSLFISQCGGKKKICIFCGIRFIASRDMICMKAATAAHSSWQCHQKCTFINFMFHCFSCKFCSEKNSIISIPDMCIWFPSWSTIFLFFLSHMIKFDLIFTVETGISISFHRRCLSAGSESSAQRDIIIA